jgi:hypothetical protein
LIGGEKGGVGKSVVARVLAQTMVDRSLPFAAIDGDGSHAALVRHYKDFTQPVDLNSSESADQIVDRALGAERRVLVDLPAQSARALELWLEEANVIQFARDMGIGITVWHVSDGGFSSVTEIERSLRLLKNQVRHVVVKNFGRSKDFSQFDASEARRLLDELSGKVLELPELHPATMYGIDRLGLSFWAAIHVSEGEAALKPLERQRVKLWLERCYSRIDALDGAL